MDMQSKDNGFDKTVLTIFTIPESFVHIETGKLQNVTPEMYRFFQEHVDQNNLINAFMTAIFQYVHGDRHTVNFDKLEMKMEEVLQIVKGNNLFSTPVQQTSTEQADLPNDLEELLDEFGG